jgi:thimet oligopeptidase
VDGIRSLTEDIIAERKTTLDLVGAVKQGEHSWKTVIQPLIDADHMNEQHETAVTFLAHVSSDEQIRDACNEADDKLRAFGVDADMRMDVYQAIVAFSQSDEAKSLQGESKRYVDRLLRDARRNGLHLDEESRDKLSAIKKRLNSLGIEFQKKLGAENTTFEWTRSDLEGMSEQQLQGFKKKKKALEKKNESNDGNAIVGDTDDSASTDGADQDIFIVSLKYPDYIPLMEYCSNANTRKTMESAFNSRCKQANTAIIEEMVVLRAQQAKILSFESHAAFVLDIRMAKTSGKVMEFLNSLNRNLEPLLNKEKAALLDLKKQECEAKKQTFDNQLHSWDRTYFSRLFESAQFQIDQQEIQQYFPLTTVTAGLFQIYQQLLGLRFEEVNMDKLPAGSAWHEDVKLYNVFDTQDKYLVGQFYIDLHPRPGKYGHAACFGLYASVQEEDSSGIPVSSVSIKTSRRVPVAACVCNFPKSTADTPSLLSHKDVVTFFHEFGESR